MYVHYFSNAELNLIMHFCGAQVRPYPLPYIIVHRAINHIDTFSALSALYTYIILIIILIYREEIYNFKDTKIILIPYYTNNIFYNLLPSCTIQFNIVLF